MSYVTQFFTPCFEERELDAHQMYVHLFTNLVEYFCVDDGEQLTSIFVEQGVDCIDPNDCKIRECLMPTPSEFFDKKFPFTFNNSQCK